MKLLEAKTTLIVQTLRCDRCSLQASVGDPEFSEFLTFSNTGGYDSVFGDGAGVEIDLCQHCTKEVLGPWIALRRDTGVISD